MVHFIHLSLLLATAIQLPLVTAKQNLNKVTVQFPQQWNVKCCCRNEKCERCESDSPRVKLTNNALTIGQFHKKDTRSYLCYQDSDTDAKCLYLKVTIESQPCNDDDVCIKLYLCEPNCGELCRNCTDHINQHIQSSNETVIQLDEGLRGKCPLQNSSYNINGLQFYGEAKSWIDAVKHCQNRNSSPVEITNQTVQTAVNFFLRNKTDEMPKGVWIGLQRSIFGKNVPWMWISGSEAVFSQWNSSIPVDRFNNHCGKIIWVEDSEEFEWLDGNCHDKLPFICQGWFNQSLHHNYTTDGNENPT